MNREAIFEALFDRVKNLSGFNLTSRRGRLAKDVPAEQQPALFMEEGPGEPVQNPVEGGPAIYKLLVDLGFYARIPEDAAPGAVLNPLIDAICNALAPEDDEDRQTLGGLVYYCRIDGKILKNEGLMDGQASIVIPVEILAM